MIAPLSLMRKNPVPLMARSRLLFVKLTLPWENCWVIAATFTPLPMVLAPVPRFEAGYTSANSARDALKPLVLLLAMLLPTTFRSEEAALRPLMDVLNAMMTLLALLPVMLLPAEIHVKKSV